MALRMYTIADSMTKSLLAVPAILVQPEGNVLIDVPRYVPKLSSRSGTVLATANKPAHCLSSDEVCLDVGVLTIIASEWHQRTIYLQESKAQCVASRCMLMSSAGTPCKAMHIAGLAFCNLLQ